MYSYYKFQLLILILVGRDILNIPRVPQGARVENRCPTDYIFFYCGVCVCGKNEE
jgi:hypothetical protein